MVNKRGKRESLVGLIVLILYTGGLIFVSCFHELWFDETQAWQIARCASFKEILTVVPHYEGHPPFWHLLLTVFAKNGVPVDLTLKAINITFSTAAMALLIFRSPFPKAVKYVLPFTYFLFFHYGIYCRPYSVTMLAFFLMAIAYRKRSECPGRYVFSLILLCMTTAYGIIIAGGLCLVWTLEIITELYKGKKLVYFWKDKRFYWLCLILIIAVWLIISIIPAEDCFYVGVDKNNSFKELITQKTAYQMLAILPFESWSGILISQSSSSTYAALLWCEYIVGLAMWISLITVTAKNRKFFTFFVPYFLVSSFMAFKYMASYHLGVGALLHIFVFWIILEKNGGKMQIPLFMLKIKDGITSAFVRKIAVIGVSLICSMNVIFSIVASYNDITKICGFSWVADFIKENHLEDTKIMVSWAAEEDETEDIAPEDSFSYMFKALELPSVHKRIVRNSTYLQSIPPVVLPYFDENIFMNFNVECPDDLYMHYKYKEDSVAIMQKWREKGLPDFIVGYCPIDEIYGEAELEGVKYLPIVRKEMSYIYKLNADGGSDSIYIREDLLDDYPQFRWIDDQRGNIYERK